MHTGTLTGKQALVTGGSRGIGRGIVERLCAEGATVVFCYRGERDAAAEVEASTGAVGVQADLATAEGVAGLRFTNKADILEVAARRTPLGRLGQPSDIAAVVAFLAGPDGAWITGQHIAATGGLR